MQFSVKKEIPPEDGIATIADVVAITSDCAFVARVKHWTGLDRPIAFNILARLWSAAAGVVTVLLIAQYLTSREQGYYYTFFSLVALQVVFELGFCFVILQVAAHERAHVMITAEGDIGGDAIALARLGSVLRMSIRWYAVAAAAMIAALLPAGSYFLGRQGHSDSALSWSGPWALLVIATALNLMMSVISAFIEGCGFVALVARAYLAQVVCGSVLSWCALTTRHGLYAPAMLLFGFSAMQGVFVIMPKPQRRLLLSVLKAPVGIHGIGWRREIWPFQWRIAITWLSSYFISQLMTPALFLYQGAVVAGRMGMALSISTSIGAIGLAWMSTKSAPFGSMVARREIKTLDRLFFRTFRQSTVLVAAGATACFVCLLAVHEHMPRLAARVLPPSTFGFLLLTMMMNHILFSEALYMRAHKREPLLVQSTVVAGCLAVSTITLARFCSASAVVAGYFILAGVVSVAWGTCIFAVKRREWYKAQ